MRHPPSPLRLSAQGAVLAALACVAALGACAPRPPLRLILVSALRGVIQPIEREGAKYGGFALLAGAIETERKEAEGPVALVGNLNFLHGTPEAWFTRGRAVVELMNEVGFDALVVGPRDFYFGAETLAALATTARFPFLSANIVDGKGRSPAYLKPWWYHAASRTGFIGLSPAQVLSQNLAKDVAGLALVDDVEAATRAVAELKAAGARRIGLFAGGVYWGAAPGSAEAQAAERLLAVEGIDQYYFGAANPSVPEGVLTLGEGAAAKLLVVQSGARFLNGALIASLGLPPDPRDASLEEIKVDSLSALPSTALSDRLAELRATVGGTMSRKVADVAAAFSLDLEAECEMGNFITDLFRDYSKTDIFILNSGKIRAGFKPGPLTRLDVYNVLPFSGQVVVLEATGAQILRLLERSCTFPGNARAGRGWLQVSGLSFAWNPEAPAFGRVLPGSVRLGGLPLDLERVYRLGTEAYIFGGGDGYAEFAELGIRTLELDSHSMLQVLQDRLEVMGTLVPGQLGRALRSDGD